MADYTMKHLEHVQDVLGDYPGEMRMMTGDLEAEQVAFTYRRMPQHTGGKGSYGHRHKEQDEVDLLLLLLLLLVRPSPQGAGGGLLRRVRQAPVQARRRGGRARARLGRAGRTTDVALGLEQRARGRRADHRLEGRPGRFRRRRRVHGELLAGVDAQVRIRYRGF